MIKNLLTRVVNDNYINTLNLVLDVKEYPSFVNWCTKTSLITNPEFITINDLLINYNFQAELTFSYSIFSYQYTSDINYFCNNDYAQIVITSNNGPFKRMKNIWTINKINNNQSKIDFYIEIELKNLILEKIAMLNINFVSNTILTSFEKQLQKKSKTQLT